MPKASAVVLEGMFTEIGLHTVPCQHGAVRGTMQEIASYNSHKDMQQIREVRKPPVLESLEEVVRHSLCNCVLSLQTTVAIQNDL